MEKINNICYFHLAARTIWNWYSVHLQDGHGYQKILMIPKWSNIEENITQDKLGAL